MPSDNPPAFPIAPILPDVREGSDGMTLRDWFAGQALNGLLARLDTNRGYNRAFTEAAPAAYRLADAMLAERNRNAK